jgi:hypothetical protein
MQKKCDKGEKFKLGILGILFNFGIKTEFFKTFKENCK